ncbi:thiosulfate sulfurtransferase GlpE [Paraferrimonas sp. SM1919]|uniref:thiosulfate sulfurtransferase GlpE n=1 Tax=Paraferrimonas sp. SM1919 TaxID=2662263 RepID=UPI0013D23EF8|nr:thiosulfate sulfurtransferase GlpE [Paraferrimonas sp. SM1919]
MQTFTCINQQQLQQMMQQHDNLHIVDIRDPQSFNEGHIEGSIHLSNETMQDFMAVSEFDDPVVVVCYHGISSKQAAQYLIGLGYEDTYSLDGGFSAYS